MTRKLTLALSLVAALVVVAGCKEDSNTSVKFDPKAGNMYKGQDQYKQGGGANTATTTTSTQ